MTPHDLQKLRAYAIVLTGSRQPADDLLESALAEIYGDQRVDLGAGSTLVVALAVVGMLHSLDLQDAASGVPDTVFGCHGFWRLSVCQRDALFLSAGLGLTPSDVALVSRCPLGDVETHAVEGMAVLEADRQTASWLAATSCLAPNAVYRTKLGDMIV